MTMYLSINEATNKNLMLTKQKTQNSFSIRHFTTRFFLRHLLPHMSLSPLSHSPLTLLCTVYISDTPPILYQRYEISLVKCKVTQFQARCLLIRLGRLYAIER